MTRKEWASKDALIAEVADVPENWLRGFAIRHPLDCRKFAAKRNGSMMYRVAAVLAAIEDGESMPNAGIAQRDESGAIVYAGEAGAQGQPTACAAGAGQGAHGAGHGAQSAGQGAQGEEVAR